MSSHAGPFGHLRVHRVHQSADVLGAAVRKPRSQHGRHRLEFSVRTEWSLVHRDALRVHGIGQQVGHD